MHLFLRFVTTMLAALLICSTGPVDSAAETASPTTTSIENPVLRGFNPDPSIIRVGDDYYIATSTFEWFPGVRIHHSRDLVHWRLLGHALTRRSQLDLRGAPPSGGVWAPDLSYSDGRFHLVFTNVRNCSGGFVDAHNYLVTAERVEGPWSEPVYLNSGGFDPSLFHDDDRKWLLNMVWDHRHDNKSGGIVIQEYDPSLGQLVGEPRLIFKGTAAGGTEGPHIYKHGGYYHLMTAEGGTGYGHQVTMARSRSVTGPYELDPGTPLLTSSHNPSLPLQKAGHASLVDSGNGHWYVAFLCGRPLPGTTWCNLGRETALRPCRWTDEGWLRLDGGGCEPRVTLPAPGLPPHPWPAGSTREEFDGPGYDPQFNTLREPPDPSWHSLRERPGFLRLRGRESLTSRFDQSLVACRLRSQRAEVTTGVSFVPKNSQQMAGLICRYDERNLVYLRIATDESLGRNLSLISLEQGRPLQTDPVPVEETAICHLRAEFDFSSLRFSYSLDGEQWNVIGPEYDAGKLSDDFCHGFTGTFVGLAVQDLSGGLIPADFDYFEYREPDGASSAADLHTGLARADDSRPYTRWWWFASEIRREDIAAQLDWLKAHNFGGVEIAWVYPLNIERYAKYYPMIGEEERRRRAPRLEWLGEEWSGVAAFAKRYANHVGLGCDFTFGSAWPFGDSLVPPGDRTKIFGQDGFDEEIIISWEYPQYGHTIDHLDRGALERYGDRMGAALAEALKGRPSALFCDSWEVETRRIWTAGFGQAFRQRYGYDIAPYMDGIYQPERSEQRYDYLKLISEYVIDQFYRPFTEICHRRGALSRVQCCGSPTDIITAYAAVDIPESEMMLYEPGYSRIVASAACLAGRPVVSCETFTCMYGWPRERIREEQIGDLKLVADAAFANGVNRIIWHGTPFNAPDREEVSFYASVHVGREGTLAPHLKDFNRYLETVSSLMTRGRTRADVAVYLPLEDAWVAGEYPAELQLPWSWGAYELRYVAFPEELRGCQPLWINRHFLERGDLEDGVLRCGDAAFALLYVDVKFLDSAALDTILGLAERGLKVCLKGMPREPGVRKSGDYQARLERLLGLDNVSREYRELQPDPPLLSGNDLPLFWCREEGEYCYIFIAHPEVSRVSYPIEPGQWSRAQETVREVVLHSAGRAQTLELRFAPLQSLMLRVDRSGNVEYIDLADEPCGISRESDIDRPPQRHKSEQLASAVHPVEIPTDPASGKH